MEITPLPATRALTPGPPATEGNKPHGPESRGAAVTTSQETSEDRSIEQVQNEPNELAALAVKTGLELRLQRLPDSDVTLIRMVEPHTGEVVIEFPPEGLAKGLAELRARAAARLDRKA
jgi:uncharacterized FlaG/YvyC family protein